MCSACAMTSPRASKIAVEQSCRSLMLVEYDDLMSAVPISSAMVQSAAPMPSSVTRSMASPSWAEATSRLARCLGDHEESEIVDLSALVRQQQGRGVELLDDGRARDRVAGQQARAVVDRAGDE